ncbi:zinc finger protein 800 [Anthonomus grandis grandis]|uniref:zinc finger protein 800 n=1 Tax=Anthonomus grandis grandis TaxID=2921223 RepID=UPI00216680F1|nr:zinc finger protein 800 [Anthonomus grandis grandis]
MVGNNKTTKRAKKPIETTLGKAPISSKEAPDVSLLRKPIDTNLTNLKRIVSLLEGGTDEVKDILTYECDILYECRACRSIYRSIANFILHKRTYCKNRFCVTDFINNNNNHLDRDVLPQESQKMSRLTQVVDKLHEIGRVHEATKPLFTMDLSEEDPVKSMDQLDEKFSSNFNQLVLEKIDSNHGGVFQTLNFDHSTVSNKLDVMELHRKLEHDVPVLDSNGKTFGFTSSDLYPGDIFPSPVFSCSSCTNKYSSEKTLAHHIRTIHNPSRLVFLCPTCNDPFSSPWCVYRHLVRVHRMTNKQVRRVRDQVNSSMMSRGEFDAKIKKKAPREGLQEDSENQWIADIEGDKDFQVCAGCGKHFERRAALHSHSQMCAKRLEVFNSINKEKAKKKALEKVRVEVDGNERVALKGALKRKSGGCMRVNKQTSDDSILRASLVKPSRAITQTKSEETVTVKPKKIERRSYSSVEIVSDDVICLSSDDSRGNEIEIVRKSTDNQVILLEDDAPQQVNMDELSYNNPLKKLKTKTTLLDKASSYIDTSEMVCRPCKTYFLTFDLLMHHMSAHFSWFRYQCSKCSFVTYAKSDCLAHVQREHQLPEQSCVLPLPNWKSVLMSHDFRLLDPEVDFKGCHTDERICLDEEVTEKEQTPCETVKTEANSLFDEEGVEETSLKLEPCMDSEDIDMSETEDDLQVLPEPVELEMPALVSEALKPSEETVSSFGSVAAEQYEEESNDDWGIPQPVKKEEEEAVLPVPTYTRPARIRTTVKQEDFLYYDRGNLVGVFKKTKGVEGGNKVKQVPNTVTKKK